MAHQLWKVVNSSRENEKFPDDEYKFLLVWSNWDDFGYRTRYDLYLLLPEEVTHNLLLANLSIVELSPNYLLRPQFIPLDHQYNYRTFILNIASAERLLLFLTPEERQELVSKLKISFDNTLVEYQNNYQTSTLRGFRDETGFLKMQKDIKEIVTNPTNVASMLTRNLSKVCLHNDLGNAEKNMMEIL